MRSMLHLYHLLAYYVNWYLFTRNLVRDRVQTFALSRFEGIETAGFTFSRSAGRVF